MNSVKNIALLGNPNCGKTTLFNKLTGSRQEIGNWAGVTVERKQGKLSLDDRETTLVDLPGIYSLSVSNEEHAVDEAIACQYITSGEVDLVVNVVDASNLKRNLYLTLQLLELNIPCVIALNMMDIAKQRNISINIDKLQTSLGCPVIPLVSSRSQGISQLKQQLSQYAITNTPSAFTPSYLPQKLQRATADLTTELGKRTLPFNESMQQAMALKLLEKDVFAIRQLGNPTFNHKLNAIIAKLEKLFNEELDIVIADARYQYLETMLSSVYCHSQVNKHHLTQLLDSILLNRYLGIPIFLFIIYLVFQISIYVGGALSPLFDQGTSTVFIDGINYLGNSWHLPIWLTSLFANGLGLGINTVASFIPQIGLMFLCLSFLEDSGYMARAAFVMDRFMQAVGLPGKSFIPLIVGFGCNVPSVMATRTLESSRDRILTILMAPFMSCGARMAIFVTFGSAFFQKDAGFIIFLLYLAGIMIAMLTGLLFKWTLLKGEPAPFLLELPNYHIPDAKTMSLLVWQRLKGFLFRAGKFIIPVCIILGTLNNIQTDGSFSTKASQQSLLAKAGQAITPVFYPMGIKQENWPATVGLMTGLLAKEVVVGTLNTLYTQNSTQNNISPAQYSLLGGLKTALLETADNFSDSFSTETLNPFTANEANHAMTKTAMGNMHTGFASKTAAFAYLLFVLLYIPCVSTIGAIAREVGTAWGYFSSIWSLSVAYSVAVIFYQAASFLQTPWTSALWIIGIIAMNLLWLLGLAYSGQLNLGTKSLATQP